MTDSSFTKVKSFVSQHVPDHTYFNIPCLTENETLKMLNKLDITKSTGLDQIGPRLLKLSANHIAKSVTYLINCSIQSQTFPTVWKSAKVNPLFKTGAVDDVNNYRPISILPTLSKLIEKHVHDSFMSFLTQHALIYKSQSGFRKQHSCETALVYMIDKWLTALNEGNLIGTVMIDFRKAFDLVSHDILLKKLKLYKCTTDTLSWFYSYLTERKQSVSLNGAISEEQTIVCGVPQGSILGPLLFILFINDLPLYLEESVTNTDMYADDTTIYHISSNQHELELHLQKGLDSLKLWCSENGMVLNTAKTKVMLIATSQKRARLHNKSISLKYNDVSLTLTTGDKILGLQINENLKWDSHISHLKKKISSNIWLLSRIKGFVPLNYRIIFYKAYIQPHLDFCNIIWGSSTKTNLNCLLKLQKRACRIILEDKYTTISEAMSVINILTIEQRIILQKAKFMYKVSKNKVPLYVQEFFQSQNQAERELRYRNNLNYVVPKPNKELFKGSMSYTGPLLWNEIPVCIRECNTIESFTSNCIRWIKSKRN